MVYRISANAFIEAQTRQMEKEFKSSRPSPRNRAMGFKGSDKRSRFNRSVKTQNT